MAASNGSNGNGIGDAGHRRRRRRGRRRVRRPVHAPPAARARGSRPRCSRPADDVGGTWYWNRYPGARCDIPTTDYTYTLRPRAGDGVDVVGEVRHPARDPALPQHVADKHDLRRDIQLLDPRRVGARGTTHASLWRITHRRAATTITLPLLRDGDRLPVDAEGARHRRRRPLRRRGLLHQPLAARGRRLHRQAGRRHRHRLVGHPVDPDHRRAGRAADGVPAHAELLDPGAQRPGRRRSAWRQLDGRPRRVPRGGQVVARRRADAAPTEHGALQLSRGGAAARFEAAWEAGELFAILGVFADHARSTATPTTSSPSSSATRSARSSTTRRPPRRCARRTTRSAPSGRASTPTTTRPSTCPTSASSTCASTRSRRSPRPASTPSTSRSSSTPSSTPPASTR